MYRNGGLIYIVPCLLAVVLAVIFIAGGNGLNAEGATIVVDTAGNGDYLNIQDAIDGSTAGDTIAVWDGNYTENVVIDKTLSLVGNGTGSTTIDGGGVDCVLDITADNVNITGFRINNSKPGYGEAGINISASTGINISKNFFVRHERSILLENSDWNEIYDNKFSYVSWGVYLSYSHNNSLKSNNVTSIASSGFGVYYSNDTVMNGNNFTSGDQAVSTYRTYRTLIYDNKFFYFNYSITPNADWGTYIHNNTMGQNTTIGVRMFSSTSIIIENNTFAVAGIHISGNKIGDWNTHTIRENNLVLGNPVIYRKDEASPTIPANAAEIILGNCQDVLIEDRNIVNTSGIHIGFADNVTIFNNSITAGYHNSMNMQNINILNISKNNLTGGRFGVEAYEVSLASIGYNELYNNAYYGVTMGGVSESIIFNNSFIGANGLKLQYAVNNTIVNNTASYGVNGFSILYDSTGNLIANNNASHNSDDGFRMIYDAKDNIIINNVAYKNSGLGFRFEHLDEGENIIEDNLILSNHWGMSVHNCFNQVIRDNLALRNTDFGFRISSGGYNLFENNTALSNDDNGLEVTDTENNFLLNNNITGNQNGFLLLHTKNNYLSGNIFAFSTYEGGLIGIESVNNTFYNNIIHDNTREAIIIQSDSDGNSFFNNTISEHTQSGRTAITIDDSANNHFEGNLITKNWRGMHLDTKANDTMVKGNTFLENDDLALSIAGGQRNIIYANLFKDNTNYALNLWATIDNLQIYHNEFINNNAGGIQASSVNGGAFNLPYPGGGNYWDDHPCVDQFTGPDQNQAGYDSFCDTPYTLDGFGVKDEYPLLYDYDIYGEDTVYIISHTDGEHVTGTIVIEAVVTQGLYQNSQSVNFYLDGAKMTVVESTPYLFAIDTTSLPDGVPFAVTAETTIGGNSHTITLIPNLPSSAGDYITIYTLSADYSPDQDVSLMVDVSGPPSHDSLKLATTCTDPNGDRVFNDLQTMMPDTQYRVIMSLPSDSVQGFYFVAVTAYGYLGESQVWSSSNTTLFSVSGLNYHDSLGSLVENVSAFNSSISDVATQISDLQSEVDSMNASLDDIATSLDGLNGSVQASILALSDSLDNANSSISALLGGMEGNILENLTGINSSLAGKIQDALDSITGSIGGLNSSLVSQLIPLATSGDVDALEAWLDTVLSQVDANLTDARQSLEDQLSDLGYATDAYYDDLKLDMSKSLLDLLTLANTLGSHDAGLDENITMLEGLIENLDSTTLLEIRTSLSGLAGNISQYSDELGDDLLGISQEVSAFETETQERLSKINDTLAKLDRIEEIMASLDALSNDLEQAESELKGDIDESKEMASGGSTILIILLVLVLALALVSTLMMYKTFKGDDEQL